MEANASLQVTTALSRPHVGHDDDGSEPLCALISIQAPKVRNGECGVRRGDNDGLPVVDTPHSALRTPHWGGLPIELCLVLDASGSMHRFRLDEEQRELWRRIAQQRGDLIRERADGRDGWLWSGETLREMRGLIQTPMMAVARALTAVAKRLAPEDRLTIVAFADQAEVLMNRAGATERAIALGGTIERLTRGVDDSGLGRGSRLAAALTLALRVMPRSPNRACRILVVSDGVVEERAACLQAVEAAADEGVLISTVGVGDEFDEELLMRMADDSRGRYTYAPSAPEVETALGAEVASLAGVAAHRLTITIRPETDVVFRELFQLTPAVSRFNTLWMENGGYRYRLGDLAGDETIQLLAEFALPPVGPGPNPVASARLAADGARIELSLAVTGTNDPEKVWERDTSVVAAMEAVQAYLGERRAQEAAARGDFDEATRQLRHTTRILRQMGQPCLAGDFEAMAADFESGRTVSLNRTKRLKAATRRIAPNPAVPSAPPLASAQGPEPRDLVHDR